MFGYCYYLQPTSRPRHSEAVALVAAQCCCCSLPRLYCLFVLSLHYPGRRSGGPQQQSYSEGRSRTCAGNGRRCPGAVRADTVRVDSARQTGRDSRNSSAGNYDLHTDAGRHHHHQPDLGPTTALAPIVQPAIVQQLETPAEETKIVIKDESSCEEFKSNLTMTGCGWKFMVVF